ncbi:MAG: hypothetical protein D6785_09345, partial [Planctomycetota bacterium]
MNILFIGENPLQRVLYHQLQPQKAFAIGSEKWPSPVTVGKLKFQEKRMILNWMKLNKVSFALPLCAEPIEVGLMDYLKLRRQRVFGPLQRLLTKWQDPREYLSLISKFQLPLKEFYFFDQVEKGMEFLRNIQKFPIYIKSWNPSRRVQVFSLQQAQEILQKMLRPAKSADTPPKWVSMEPPLPGPEIYLYVLADGKNLLPLDGVEVVKQDDQGFPFPYIQVAKTPTPLLDEKVWKKLDKEILLWLNHLFTASRIQFRGLFEIQLKLTPKGPCILDIQFFSEPPAFLPLLT